MWDQVRMIQQKDWLSQRILEESGKYDVEALQGERNRRSSEPIQQMTEQHIPQNEEDVGIGKKKFRTIDQLRQYCHSRETRNSWKNC